MELEFYRERSKLLFWDLGTARRLREVKILQKSLSFFGLFGVKGLGVSIWGAPDFFIRFANFFSLFIFFYTNSFLFTFECSLGLFPFVVGRERLIY